MFAIIVILGLVTGGLSLLCPNKFDPQQTVHLAHPTSCSKFLTCVGDHPFEQLCPEGLHWNVQRSYCDYPPLSECSRGELEYFDTIDFDPKVVANSVCLPQFNQCPVNSNPSEQVIFMKHRDCRKFYACVATQQVELSCPPNLYWNSSSCRCDYEIDAECDGTERVEEEIPQGADGEPNEPEVDEAAVEEAAAEEAAADEPAADEAVAEAAGESQAGVVPEAEPEDVQEPEEPVDDEVVDAEAEPQIEEDQEPTQEVDQSVDIVPNVRARRAADDEGTTTTVAATTTESATTVIDTTSTAAVTTTTSSGTTGSSGGGSSGSTSGPGSGGSVESGADVRTVSSIVMIAFTAVMSVL